jgi:hypothetical protein
VARIPASLPAEQPAGAWSEDAPDAAQGDYAGYVERLEEQIAGRATPTKSDAHPGTTDGAPGGDTTP